ncbi:MAG TPA: YciI family protein [Bryobacteraceae bacterium]|nr:YciI family protein [Bryobacteraceae bacterium]
MKYILMMNCPKTGYDSFGSMPKDDIKAHIAFQHGLDKALRESGELVSAEGLADPKQAKLVRAGKHGEPITDGVFPESKEFLAGYWIVDVDSPEQAYKIAARASAAPGIGGAPMNIPIEVRQVMSGPPEEFL